MFYGLSIPEWLGMSLAMVEYELYSDRLKHIAEWLQGHLLSASDGLDHLVLSGFLLLCSGLDRARILLFSILFVLSQDDRQVSRGVMIHS